MGKLDDLLELVNDSTKRMGRPPDYIVMCIADRSGSTNHAANNTWSCFNLPVIFVGFSMVPGVVYNGK